MLFNTLLLALRSIRRNLMRSFLAILGIVIGVAAVITMVTVGNGATMAVQNQISSLGTNLLMILTLLPLQMLSGGITPRESMPDIVQQIMLAAPTTHFVSLSQAILYRGAGFDVVWPSFLAIIAIGAVFFVLALALFRRSLAAAQ